MIRNSLGAKLAKFIVLFFFVVGCYDRFFGPYLISGFSYPVRIEIKVSGKDLEKNNFYPGAFMGMGQDNQKYEEIRVYKDGALILECPSKCLNQLLLENNKEEVIWGISEKGVALISNKEAEKIHKELFKPRPRRKVEENK